MFCVVFVQAEDVIRDLVRSRGLGDVYKRQRLLAAPRLRRAEERERTGEPTHLLGRDRGRRLGHCLLYTSDAADERSSVDLGGRRIIKKKNTRESRRTGHDNDKQSESTARSLTI